MQFLLVILLSSLALFSCKQRENALAAAAATPYSKNPSDSSLSHSRPVIQAGSKDSVPVRQTGSGSFIPPGYSLLDSATGDLNGDAYTDKLLVLKKDGEEKSSDLVNHPEKRPLLILTGGPDHTYRLAARSDQAVYCVDCGGVMGDPYMGLVIKKGFFSIEQAGGSNDRWARTTTFRYDSQSGYWLLHKDGYKSYHASDPGKSQEKISTVKNFGKVPFEKFDVYKEE